METIYLLDLTAKDDSFEYRHTLSCHKNMKKACAALKDMAIYLENSGYKRTDRGISIEVISNPPKTREDLDLYHAEYMDIRYTFQFILTIRPISLV